MLDLSGRGRQYWTCQEKTDRCEKTIKAVDMSLDLKTKQRSVKAEGQLRNRGKDFAGKVDFKADESLEVLLALHRNLDFDKPMRGLKIETYMKNKKQNVFSSRAQLTRNPGEG